MSLFRYFGADVLRISGHIAQFLATACPLSAICAPYVWKISEMH
jgi:hypothetical protein